VSLEQISRKRKSLPGIRFARDEPSFGKGEPGWGCGL